MDLIDEKIILALDKDIELPDSYERTIKQALFKKRFDIKYYLIKFIITIISAITVFAGGFGAYAITGGTIEGIPAFDWLGIKISDYNYYKQSVENQAVAFGETSVELVSTMCNEGITILEFDVKLSQYDYEFLRLAEKAYTEKFEEQVQNNKEQAKEDAITKIKSDKGLKMISDIDTRNLTNDEYHEKLLEISNKVEAMEITEDEFKNSRHYEEYLEIIKRNDEALEERKNTGFYPALALNVDQVGGTYNYDIFNPDMTWYASLYIDDKPVYVNSWEKTEKINDYQYKIFAMYSLTDDQTDGKDEFKITLKNNKLVSLVDWINLKNNWRNGCSSFANYWIDDGMKVPVQRKIDLPIDFEVSVSKDAVLEDSIVINNPGLKSEFRNITHTVEKVVASPMQIVVIINHQATDQSSNVYQNRYPGKPEVEYLPLTREYKVYDANGKELSCFYTTNKNTLIYSNGTREDYDYHDIPNKKYSNAIWENVHDLIIESTDTEYIKIVPVETVHNPINDGDDYGEIYYEMDPIIINLK